MSKENENPLNEFEYTEEEKAELARLDAANEESDELTNAPNDETKLNDTDPELEVGDDLVNDLLKLEIDPLVPVDNTDTPAPETVIQPEVEIEPEPAPDYDAQLEELEQQKQAAQGEVDDTLDKLQQLAEQFDDGEVSQGKYDIEKLKLERELRRSEKTLDKAEQAHESLSEVATEKLDEYHTSRRVTWRNDLVGFLEDPANEVIANNQHIAEQFDTLLQSMGQSGVFEGLNNQQILQSVRNQLSFRVPELSKTTYAPQTKATTTKPAKPTQKANIPTSLSQMQTQEIPADDPFAFIRKLSGVEYEKAISKLSEEQQEKLLFS